MNLLKRKLFKCSCIFFIFIFVFFGLWGCEYSEPHTNENTNVFLGEEVCYAGDIFIKVIGINVVQNEDMDLGVKYFLNLTLSIEQRTDKTPKGTIISPKTFELRAINQKSKGKLAAFFEALAKISFETAVSIAFQDDVNIIEKTISLATEYLSIRVDDIQTNRELKPIKLEKNSFISFRPKYENGEKQVKISFPITEEYLETDYILILSIDAWNHMERRIFLTQRPNHPQNANG